MNLRSLGALGMAAALLLGTACGSDDDGGSDVDTASEGTTETTAASAAANDSGGVSGSAKGCDLLAKADLDAAFGGSFGDAEDTSTAGTTMCNWSSQEPIIGFSYVIKPTSASEWDATLDASRKAGAKTKSISGIGDKAAVVRLDKYGQASFQIYVTKGSAFFFTTASAPEMDPGKVETASIDLAKKMNAKL